MKNDIEKRAQLIENREEIAAEVEKRADAADKKFLIDAGFIGGLGTAVTTKLAQFENASNALTLLGTGSAVLLNF